MADRKIYLADQVKKAIGYRILICFLLALSVVLVILTMDVKTETQQLEKRLESKCKMLQDFLINQLLTQNKEAIQPKMDYLNKINKKEKLRWLLNLPKQKTSALSWHIPFKWRYTYPITDIDDSSLGTFVITGSLLSDHDFMIELITKISLLLLFFFTILVALYPLGNRIPKRLLITPINNLLLLLRQEKKYDLPLQTTEELIEISEKITNLLQDAKKSSHLAALGEIATQVAHDIRSPLTVLDIEMHILESIPEQHRNLIRQAIQRISDIANNLLSTYNQSKEKILVSYTHPELASTLIHSIVSEKRVQITNKKIIITTKINPDAYYLFIDVNAASFKRVLSNIINNAIEAISSQGKITISLSKKVDKEIYIEVTDNGCGISNNKLSAVLKKGATFGKTQGPGLGLSYVIEKIKSWNGNCTLTSEINKGTRVSIILPEAKPAEWFSSKIQIDSHNNIIILDDDEQIHKIWKGRFSENLLCKYKISLFHLRTPQELINFYSEHTNKNSLYLFDHELLGHKDTGITLAENLKITQQTFLVTNRYEDFPIREKCLKLGLKIIPKPLAPFIPINFRNRIL